MLNLELDVDSKSKDQATDRSILYCKCLGGVWGWGGVGGLVNPYGQPDRNINVFTGSLINGGERKESECSSLKMS